MSQWNSGVHSAHHRRGADAHDRLALVHLLVALLGGAAVSQFSMGYPASGVRISRHLFFTTHLDSMQSRALTPGALVDPLAPLPADVPFRGCEADLGRRRVAGFHRASLSLRIAAAADVDELVRASPSPLCTQILHVHDV